MFRNRLTKYLVFASSRCRNWHPSDAKDEGTVMKYLSCKYKGANLSTLCGNWKINTIILRVNNKRGTEGIDYITIRRILYLEELHKDVLDQFGVVLRRRRTLRCGI